ncbi:MAG TPA: alpha/beta fold hydrolase [Acidimicrobiales bacterium]|nr:alpha/beta fold hydrolase [Acidimicrobiales bacterium]
MPPEHLHHERRGSGPRLVLVHGFTQTGASMRKLASRLDDAFEVVTVDLPFHGAAPLPVSSLEEAAELLGATTGRAAYLGYSLGGRLCLTLALAHPELVEALVVVGATAGLKSEEERRERRAADEVLARRLEGDGGIGESERLEVFLADWLAGPLFAHLDAEQADLAARRANSAAGLASALRFLGTGSQQPSHDRLGELTMPVLLLAGARDEKFSAIADEMRAAIGDNATRRLIEDAGHAAPFERPDEVAAEVRRFLAP